MKRRLLASVLSLVMVLSLLPTAVMAAEPSDNDQLDQTSDNQQAQTSYVYGGCMIEFTKNSDEEDTYTATVRALTSEEATANSVNAANIGKLGEGATKVNQWDGDGSWQPSDRGPFTPADYWKVYKDKTTKVIVKNGVTALLGAAFTRYDKVTSLEWESNPTVTEIGSNFLMCSSISELTIPASVEKIGSYAFGKYQKMGIAPTKVTLQNPSVTCGECSFAYQDKDQVMIEVNTDQDVSSLIQYAEKYGYQVKNIADYGEGAEESISWLYSSGTLTLNGSGAMKDYADETAPWKQYMSKIARVRIADGIASIGANAFNGASNLKEIQFPKSVTSIGASAFANSGLTGSVRVPATVASIGENAFQNVSATIYIYNGIWNNDGDNNQINDTTIGAEHVVHYIYGANIGGSVYPRTTNVLLGVAEDGTAYVDGYSNGAVGGFNFDGGYHYSEVAPENDTSKTDDKSVVSPLFWKNTTVWPHSADVNKLVKKVVIGDNVRDLSSGLFAYCENLTELEVTGDDLVTLGGNVFMGTEIETVNLPATVTSVGSYCFGEYQGKGVNPTMITLNSNSDIKFNGKTADFNQPLIFCSSTPQAPQKITLSAHGTTNAKAYAEYAGYTFVDLDAAGGQIGTSDTYWTMKDEQTLFVYGQGATGNLTADEEKPWKNVSGITKIEVAAGVETVGAYLFSGMTGVTEVTIDSGVVNISDHAFYDLTSLHSVALPTTVASVGEYAFALESESADEFAFGVGNASAQVAENATANRNATKDQPIASGNCGKGSGGSYQNNVTYALSQDGTLTLSGTGEMGSFAWNGENQPWKNVRDQIKSVVYGEGITTSGNGAFAYCKNLTSVTLPQNSLTTLNNNTFMDAGTAAFDKLTIPASVREIGDYAFGYYNKNRDAAITQITLSNSNTTFGKHSFNGRDDITNSSVTVYVHNNGTDCTAKTKAAEYGYKYIDLDVYFSSELTENNLKYELYEGVLTLTAIDPEREATIPTANQPWAEKSGEVTKLVIGAGVKTIPENAFKDYTKLAEIQLPRTLRTIGANAFGTTDENNTELTVTIPKAVASLAADTFANRTNVKMSSYAETAGGSFEATGVTNTVKKEFKVLLIGNSYSEDASDWTATGTVSHSYEVYKSIMGDDVDLQIGLMASGGKTLAWHATNAKDNTPQYTLCLTDADGKWTTVKTVKTIKDALAYDEWDVVSLQPYGQETTTGEAGNNVGKYAFDADRFGTLSKSIPYFLDLTENLAPQAKVYYYMHLSEHGIDNYADAMTGSTYTLYTNRAAMSHTVLSYHGTTYTDKTLTDVIPVGTAIQNARTTYLTKLSNNVNESIPTLANDKVLGLQRDSGHLTYNVGRYIAALTFAEKIIPAAFRNNRTDCGMRESQSVGVLPAQYAEIARKAVEAAIRTPYGVTTLSGYENDPITEIKTAVENATYAEADWTSNDAFKSAAEAKVTSIPDAQIVSVSISGGKATVALRYGYSTANAEITYSPDAVAAAWTDYIESTKLGSTEVPGSDMKYSEVTEIKEAIKKGDSDIRAAKTAEAANAAWDASKENLLATVKKYVKGLAETVYNNGDPTVLNGNSYTVSEADYNTAVSGINSATEVSGVLSAYNTMLSKQVCRTISSVSIASSKDSMVGSGTVTLTVTKAPPDADVTVSCDDSSVEVKDNNDGTYTVALPNTTKTYTFTASIEQSDTYTAASSDPCTVSVTRYVPSASGSSVTVPATSNGSVTVSPSTASKGTTVTVTTKPNEGYELGSLEVLDKNGNALALKDLGNGKYSFTMPDGKVTVNANFVKASVSTGFADVPADAYYADAVKWAVDKGVTNGLSANLFGPYEPCTRAQIVTFLWRAAGSPEPKTTTSKMTDLDPNAYYYKAVLWAIENGITDGMTDTTFAPNATCTRGQSVTFLYRALGKKASSSANFSDVAANAFYADAVNWAVENNVTNGTSATTFSPNADCTRAEIVTFLYRAYQGK